MRYHLKLVSIVIIKKLTNNKFWRGCREMLGGDIKLVQLKWKTIERFLKKLKIKLPYDPAFQLLSIYLGKMKNLIWKHTCTPKYIAALFTIAKTWKQHKCPSTNDWFRKMWYTHTHKHMHTMEYNSGITKMTYCHLQQNGWT